MIRKTRMEQKGVWTLKTIHIQEFRALVDRAGRILAETNCGAVEVSKSAALDWAEYQTNPELHGSQTAKPCFWEIPTKCLVIGSHPGFSESIEICKQMKGGK